MAEGIVRSHAANHEHAAKDVPEGKAFDLTAAEDALQVHVRLALAFGQPGRRDRVVHHAEIGREELRQLLRFIHGHLADEGHSKKTDLVQPRSRFLRVHPHSL